MFIKLKIVETITHYVSIRAEEGDDAFGLLGMSQTERHDQIEFLKHMNLDAHRDISGTEIDSEVEQSLRHWEIEE